VGKVDKSVIQDFIKIPFKSIAERLKKIKGPRPCPPLSDVRGINKENN